MFKFKIYSKLTNKENFNFPPSIFDDKNKIYEYHHTKERNNKKSKFWLIIIIIIIKILIFLFLLFFFIIPLKKRSQFNKTIKKKNSDYSIPSIDKVEINKNYDFENSVFAIISRPDCPACGLFSYYSIHLGCIYTYLAKGYIPIIDISSFENIFNDYSIENSSNLWEEFFYQPFNYTLNEVKLKAKKIEYFTCGWTQMAPSESCIYLNQLTIDFHREFSKKYMPLKNQIINEAKIVWEQLFNKSTNILGVLGRGTDFVALEPSGHSIPPTTEKMIEDVKNMDKKNKYDWIYLATEDDKIREKFSNEFREKLKIYQNKTTNYNDGYISDNIKGFKSQKIYLISMIILSKCIDIVLARCSGGMGVFIFTQGFRESIIYFLGQY